MNTKTKGELTMEKNKGENEILEKREIDVIDFLKNIPLNDEDKTILVMSISTIMHQVMVDTVKTVTAACMGLSQDSPEFNTFFSNGIEQVVSASSDNIYNDLSSEILGGGHQ